MRHIVRKWLRKDALLFVSHFIGYESRMLFPAESLPLPPQPERNRHELHVWTAAHKHLVVARFGEHLCPVAANSELKTTSHVETWSIGAERCHNSVYGNHGREAHAEKGITGNRTYIRGMAHLQPAMVQTGSCDDIRCH